METLTAAWPVFVRRLTRSNTFAIGTDLDGTLVPLMDRPEAVTLSGRAVAVLNRLVTRSRTSVAIVSGRSLFDLAKRAPIPNAVLIGNHGLEAQLPGQTASRSYDETDIAVAHAVLSLLGERLSAVSGLQIEDKGPVLAVHYRRVATSDVPIVLGTLRDIAAQLSPLVRVIEGSAVFEFCPGRAFGKGHALLTAWNRLGVPADALRIYFGNDVTDEDVFAKLGGGSFTVFVGDAHANSAARYVVRTPDEVLDTLEEIDQILGRDDEPDDTFNSAGRPPAP